MPLDPRRARQSHTAGQARRRTKFCPFASVSPKRHTITRTRRFPVLPPTSRSERFCDFSWLCREGIACRSSPPHAVTTLRLKNHLPPLPPLMNCGHALTATTSQAVTNRLADRRIAAATAAPPDEAAPTEPHRYILRPSLPRRRVGQLQVAGDGAAAAPKGVPPCSSQVLPPAEPGSGRVAPSTNRAAYTWRVVGESAYSASIRCSVVRPSQQARFSHPPPRWPTEDGAPTWERESRTCRRGSQGAQGEQGARGVTDGSRACGRAGSPAVRRRGAASPLPPSRRHRSC